VLAKAMRDLVRNEAGSIQTSSVRRKALGDMKMSVEQTIDTASKDEVTAVAFSPEARERSLALLESFEERLSQWKPVEVLHHELRKVPAELNEALTA
jgi:hypothetical protein